jgi:AraC-like DNA-binding protein
MDRINPPQHDPEKKADRNEETARESARMQASREELVQRIMRFVPGDTVVQPFNGLFLARASRPLERIHSVVKPSFCVIAQGSKEILLGNNRYQYDPDHYLIATLELPRVSQILEASKELPYLSFRLELDSSVVSSVMMEADQFTPTDHIDVLALDVSPMDVNLQDAVVRLVRLLDSPVEAPVLMPLITREIVYRLLNGEQGVRLRHLAVAGASTPLIAKAVERLREDMSKPLRVADLARELGMSVSGLHHHFKAVTAMSPMQFQKHLRLQEARRLMLSEDLDAASTAYRLGYHDAAHFNRDYKSLFGISPMRDVQRLRDAALSGANAT